MKSCVILLLLFLPILTFAQQALEVTQLKAVLRDAGNSFKNIQSTKQLSSNTYIAIKDISGTEYNRIIRYSDSTANYDAVIKGSGKLNQVKTKQLFSRWQNIVRKAAEGYEELEKEAVHLGNDIYGCRYLKKEGSYATTVFLTYTNEGAKGDYSLLLSLAQTYEF